MLEILYEGRFTERPADNVEYVVDVDPLPQSSGHVLDGGDCAYCCIAGIFGLPTILSAYELVESHMPEEGGWRTRCSMSVHRNEMFFESVMGEFQEYQPPFMHYRPGLAALPWDNTNWIWGVRQICEAGHVLLASIRLTGSPPRAPRTGGDTDHAVIINGFRQKWVPSQVVGGKSLSQEVRISCSAKGRYWIDWENFLYYHHGYPAIVVDPVRARASAGS
jgi:hypothetical protein